MPPRLSFFADEKKATRDDIKGAPVTVAFEDPQEGQTIRAFKAEGAFRTWARQHAPADQLNALDALVREAREAEGQDHARVKRLLLSRHRWLEQELKELERDTGLKPPELYLRAKQAPAIEGPLLDTAVCHEHQNGTGNAVFLVWKHPVPDFGWFNMNNKTSSLTFIGWGTLWDDTWFRGSTFWFFGITVSPPMDLSLAFWNDRASSGISYD